MVKIRLFASFREMVGKSSFEIDIGDTEANIYELIEKLNVFSDSEFNKFKNLLSSPRAKIILNGKSLNKSKIKEVKIKNSDELVFLPPVGGG